MREPQSKAWLHFSNGSSFSGLINRSMDDASFSNGIWGEAAFTTSMSGYQETMTDPSYLGQHIVFTTSHVGNYSFDSRQNQSERVHATALIARHFSSNSFLSNCGVPLLSGVDTRSLVRFLTRSPCSHKSVITSSPHPPSPSVFKQQKLICNDLDKVGQREEIHIIREGAGPIVVVNYGVKEAIVNRLTQMNYPLVIVSHKVDVDTIKNLQPRLVFLSNGPGNPEYYEDQIETIKELLSLNIPLRGICLGHQLLSLALGAKTERLPFGQRGINHPVLDHRNGNIVITSQNHGYCTGRKSFEGIMKDNISKRELFVSHSSLFDRSIEGLSSTDGFISAVQFHPEGNPGPHDGDSFFKELESYLSKNQKKIQTTNLSPLVVPGKKKSIPYKNILLIGSGPIRIGQASEFDYSGTQACKALKELGVRVVLLNSNPATIMTDIEMADRTYIEPIIKEVVKKIIIKEKIDSVISTMGGQTALNLCIDLEKEGFLKEHNIELLGANAWTIEHTENRNLFASELKSLGYKTSERFDVYSLEEAMEISSLHTGLPLIIRRDFALGGQGAVLVRSEEELKNIFSTEISFPVSLERSLLGQKEIELEVMVDKEENGVVICSIENIDPCGVHTGDSITVAPAQTISDRCYQRLRTMALCIARHMKVVAGGANIQFAINPNDEDDITVIEMNPRVSRSSALASKATGYPIAKISTLLAVGFTLKDILNDITRASPVAFEPTLDYVAVKIPVFPFDKFPTSSCILGPQMRSVGEVLALAGSFNEAFLKALRSTESGLDIPGLSFLKYSPEIEKSFIKNRLERPHELSLLTVIEALRLGMDEEEICHSTNITPWFIEKMKEITDTEQQLKQTELFANKKAFFRYKEMGFSDKHLAFITDISEEDIYNFRHKNKITPVYKAVDTCSGEFHAQTPYFYSTYGDENEVISLSETGNSILILGSGPNRIGQGIEFDYSCVKSCNHLREKNIQTVMVNSNPETVSTDYDTSDRLYLSPLCEEDLFDLLIMENPRGIITCFSGQTGIKIRGSIQKSFRDKYHQFNFLGSSLKSLDLAENRELFSRIVSQTDLAQTRYREVQGMENMMDAINEIGLPVIIRPSYVLGGESMYIFRSFEDIERLPEKEIKRLKDPRMIFQVETYLEGSLEYDVDLVRDRWGHTVFTVCEHIEYAGVHSGDSGMTVPSIELKEELYEKMKKISIQLAEILGVIGPVNFQYAVKEEKIYCIEANPRGSRTLPFLSKACNLSLPQVATDAMIGESIDKQVSKNFSFYAIKQSSFPFDRFLQDDILLGPKMRSTGETMGMGIRREDALIKSYLGNYPGLIKGKNILASLSDESKEILLPFLSLLHEKGHGFYATKGTREFIKAQGIPCTLVAKLRENEGISLLEIIQNSDLNLVLNTPMNQGKSKSDGERIRNRATSCGIPCFTRKENIRAVLQALSLIRQESLNPVNLQELYKQENNVPF